MAHDSQNCAELNPTNRIMVSEPNKRTHQATVDTKTADSGVVWILTDFGVSRALGLRNGVT